MFALPLLKDSSRHYKLLEHRGLVLFGGQVRNHDLIDSSDTNLTGILFSNLSGTVVG